MWFSDLQVQKRSNGKRKIMLWAISRALGSYPSGSRSSLMSARIAEWLV